MAHFIYVSTFQSVQDTQHCDTLEQALQSAFEDIDNGEDVPVEIREGDTIIYDARQIYHAYGDQKVC